MSYRYAPRADHSDLAGGQVLRSVPGQPGFPVRLADELARRALAHLDRRPLALWDPCCGGGYLAAVLGLLHREHWARVYASDIDQGAVDLARGNLALLTGGGLAGRAQELRRRAEDFAKPGYRDTAEAAGRLADLLHAGGGDVPTAAWRADAFRPAPPPAPVDLVVTDPPYGALTAWSGAVPEDPVPALLHALAEVLPPHAVIVVTQRARKVALGGIPALERVRVGSRAAAMVRAAALG